MSSGQRLPITRVEHMPPDPSRAARGAGSRLGLQVHTRSRTSPESPAVPDGEALGRDRLSLRQAVASRLAAFEMKIAWWGPRPKESDYRRAESLMALARDSDVLVDFSAPAALEFNLDAAIHAGVPIVVGTTGLEERYHWLIDSAAVSIPVLQTGNTS